MLDVKTTWENNSSGSVRYSLPSLLTSLMAPPCDEVTQLERVNITHSETLQTFLWLCWPIVSDISAASLENCEFLELSLLFLTMVQINEHTKQL